MNEAELICFREEMLRLRRGYRALRFLLATALATILGLIIVVFGNPAPVAAQSARPTKMAYFMYVVWWLKIQAGMSDCV
jgi:hypothetical protein